MYKLTVAIRRKDAEISRRGPNVTILRKGIKVGSYRGRDRNIKCTGCMEDLSQSTGTSSSIAGQREVVTPIDRERYI